MSRCGSAHSSAAGCAAVRPDRPRGVARQPTTSSRSSMAARSQWKARLMRSPSSLSLCRARCSLTVAAGREQYGSGRWRRVYGSDGLRRVAPSSSQRSQPLQCFSPVFSSHRTRNGSQFAFARPLRRHWPLTMQAIDHSKRGGTRTQTAASKTSIAAAVSRPPPSGADSRRPQEWFFSVAIINPSTSIQPRFPMPTTNISNMSSQQQPTQ